MRWKALFFEQGSNDYIPENYGFKSLNFPPKIKEIANFENDLTNLLKKVKLRAAKKFFQ